MNRKTIVLLLCAIFFAFVACGKEEKKPANKGEDTKAVETRITNLKEAYGTEVPAYETTEGDDLPVYPEGNGGYQVYIQRTNKEEFERYAQLLKKNGFSVYSEKKVSAGSDYSDKNAFITYTGRGIHVLLAWYPALSSVRIIITPEEELPSLKKPKLEVTDTVKPTVTQMQLDVEGMMYVIQLVDGKFIVIDGGMYGFEDTLRLHDFLIDKTPEGQKPTIATWIFTHEHPDHIQLPKEFIPRYKDEIALESVSYRFPSKEFVSVESANSEAPIKSIEELIQIVKTNYPDAIHYQLHAGQCYYYKGMELEILHTTEEFYPYIATSWNDTSLGFRMIFDSGKTAMFLGDSTPRLCQIMVDIYGDYLKSDVMQLTHHGLLGGNLELYQNIDPDICFWATSEAKFNGTYTGYRYKYCLGEGGCDYNAYIRDDSIKKREHYHNGTTSTILMLPASVN